MTSVDSRLQDSPTTATTATVTTSSMTQSQRRLVQTQVAEPTIMKREEHFVEYLDYDDDFDEFRCCCPSLHVKHGIYFLVVLSFLSIFYFGIRIVFGSYSFAMGVYFTVYIIIELIVVVLLLIGLWKRISWLLIPYMVLLVYNILARLVLIGFCVWVSFTDYDPLHLVPFFDFSNFADYNVRKGVFIMALVFTSIFAIFLNLFFFLVTNSVRRYINEVNRSPKIVTSQTGPSSRPLVTNP